MVNKILKPWLNLSTYKGTFFEGEWPTIPQQFSIMVSKFGDRPLFTHFEDNKKITLTYNEASQKMALLATTLKTQGVNKGDCVILSGNNSTEWAISYMAITMAGAVIVPLDKEMHADHIDSIADRTEAVFMIADKKKMEGLKHIFKYGTLSLTSTEENYIFKHLASSPVELPQAQLFDTAAILFTSGTTGQEKGVVLTHKNFVTDSFYTRALMDVNENDVYYVLLPIHHAYCMTGVFLMALMTGAELVFAKSMAISTILFELKEGKVTMLMGIPLLFNKIIAGIMGKIKARGPVVYAIMTTLMAFSGFCKKVFGVNIGKKLFKGILDKASLSNIKVMISGGGPLSPKTFKLYNQLGLDFVQGYGLTETGPIITLNPIWYYKETSVGQVVPHTTIEILDPNKEGIGEIAVKGDMVFEGYYKNVIATAEAFTNSGLFKTGDLGWKDDENYIYITGRKKNIIVTEGGKNVYPEEIEYIFQLTTEFEQLLIAGYVVNEELKSEEIEAIILPNKELFKNKTQDEMDEEIKKLIREGNQKLTSYQQISRIRIINEPLALSSTQKIKRFISTEGLGRIIMGN